MEWLLLRCGAQNKQGPSNHCCMRQEIHVARMHAARNACGENACGEKVMRREMHATRKSCGEKCMRREKSLQQCEHKKKIAVVLLN